MNPKEAMSVIKSDELDKIADEVTNMLSNVINDIENRFSQ